MSAPTNLPVIWWWSRARTSSTWSSWSRRSLPIKVGFRSSLVGLTLHDLSCVGHTRFSREELRSAGGPLVQLFGTSLGLACDEVVPYLMEGAGSYRRLFWHSDKFLRCLMDILCHDHTLAEVRGLPDQRDLSKVLFAVCPIGAPTSVKASPSSSSRRIHQTSAALTRSRW